MIEVMHPKDIEQIDNAEVVAYLHQRFEEMGYRLHPQTEGYFLYVEDFMQLYESHPLHYVTLPSISGGLLQRIEGVKIQEDIVEIILIFNNEFTLSLVLYKPSQTFLQMITKGEER
jgi:hypothetical protein